MAPIERGAQRLLAWRRIAQPADQDGQGIVQAPHQVPGSEQRDVPRGELDGQWHPVDTPADLGDRSGVGFAEREAGVARPTAVGEEADRRGPLNALEVEPIQLRREMRAGSRRTVARVTAAAVRDW